MTEVDHYTSYANYAAGTSNQIVQYRYDAFNHVIERILDADGSAGTIMNGEIGTIDAFRLIQVVQGAAMVTVARASLTRSIAMRMSALDCSPCSISWVRKGSPMASHQRAMSSAAVCAALVSKASGAAGPGGTSTRTVVQAQVKQLDSATANKVRLG